MLKVVLRLVSLAPFVLCAPALAAQLECRVTGVVGGSTLMCLTADKKEERIRLRGIDVPGHKQPFGERARESLVGLAHGKSATVHWTRRDHYGRIVGAVWVKPADCQGCGHTLDVGRALLALGMARWNRQQASLQPVEERHAYEFEENEARVRGIGLWHDSNPLVPWER